LGIVTVTAAQTDEGDLAFSFRSTKGGDVTVLRQGKVVTVLRGDSARSFLEESANASFLEQQQLMARITGNYKRGNERLAGGHPRNGGKSDA
jgi:sulfur transfer complex TusBCD TusB component (DsrH family)